MHLQALVTRDKPTERKVANSDPLLVNVSLAVTIAFTNIQEDLQYLWEERQRSVKLAATPDVTNVTTLPRV